MTGASSGPATPTELAAWLSQPPPTVEQSEVIAADRSPGVVVAGAGSGKTETMAARVVWLVATGRVTADQVLGLTFTRKAAGELADRVRRRLTRLAALTDPTMSTGLATVTTYDAFAAQVVAENAGLVGEEVGQGIVTPAGAWQLAAAVVHSYDGDMSRVDLAPSTVVERVLTLHSELSGHLRDPADLVDFAADLRDRVTALPTTRTGAGLYADVAQMLDRQDARAALVPLVEEFRAAKRQAEVVDFADVTERAVEILRASPEVARRLRASYPVVLLDEYQDTSHAQLEMLRLAFGDGHSVTAVGDPCQSIYAWRGASAGSMSRFSRHFRSADGQPARSRPLSTSFRNAQSVLAVANVVSEPLRRHGWDVPLLHPRPGAPTGTVEVALYRDIDTEAREVAVRAQRAWDEGLRRIAVLVRTRAQITRIDTALRAQGLPVEVVGVGGLLATPEVVDVVSALRVVSDPLRGDAVLRLLAGPRLRLGARDLHALGRWAKRQTRGGDEWGDATRAGGEDRHGPTGRLGEPGTSAPAGERAVDEVPLSEVLHHTPPPTWLTPEGRRRVERLASDMRRLRAATSAPLPDLVRAAAQLLGLDVETRVGTDPAGTANLDRLEQVAADFVQSRPQAGVADFLAYLDAAQTQEQGLAPGEVEVHGDRVQVLTVHGAKGLEWQAVFVVGMVEGVFPSGSARDKAWLTDVGMLPFPLRGDVDDLTRLQVSEATDQKGVRDAVLRFADDAGAAGRTEERRLVYVAMTRAEDLLVCTGYRWGDGKRCREPSPFLLEVKDARPEAVVAWAEDAGDRPITLDASPVQWPVDPLGHRRAEIARAAELVVSHLPSDATPTRSPHVDTPSRAEAAWSREINVLLAERAGQGQPGAVVLPARLSASQLVALHEDPDGLAASLRRPMPGRSRRARRGTAFHAWVEQHYGLPQLLDLDDLPGAADTTAEDAELTALTDAFARSVWATRQPLDIEVGFDLVLGRHVVRGRADAVFRSGHGLEVVDWKTGHEPTSPDRVATVAVQLAVYRLAMARVYDLPVERVSAAFHYVPEDRTVTPVDLLDESDLTELIQAVPEADVRG